MNFYISDTHFGHANIIRFDNRPFKDIEEMDKTLIENWNNTVKDEDYVYILGDFSWYGEDKTLKILDELKGHKVLIKGNHDKITQKLSRKFHHIKDYEEVFDKDYANKVVLSHYPIPFWNGQFNNSVHLYGHVHNSHQWNYCLNIQKELKELQAIPMQMYNVGCMINYMNYTPRTLKEILSANEKKNNENTCVVCGDIIPEGRIICPNCEI